ncbi:MAG: hypothetical protein RLZZ142_2455 [Verrucomicrobiota bacterium]
MAIGKHGAALAAEDLEGAEAKSGETGAQRGAQRGSEGGGEMAGKMAGKLPRTKYTAFRCPLDLLEEAKVRARGQRRSLSNYLIRLIEQDVGASSGGGSAGGPGVGPGVGPGAASGSGWRREARESGGGG